MFDHLRGQVINIRETGQNIFSVDYQVFKTINPAFPTLLTGISGTHHNL